MPWSRNTPQLSIFWLSNITLLISSQRRSTKLKAHRVTIKPRWPLPKFWTLSIKIISQSPSPRFPSVSKSSIRIARQPSSSMRLTNSLKMLQIQVSVSMNGTVSSNLELCRLLLIWRISSREADYRTKSMVWCPSIMNSHRNLLSLSKVSKRSWQA